LHAAQLRAKARAMEAIGRRKRCNGAVAVHRSSFFYTDTRDLTARLQLDIASWYVRRMCLMHAAACCNSRGAAGRTAASAAVAGEAAARCGQEWDWSDRLVCQQY
jgi:hypothetical protein